MMRIESYAQACNALGFLRGIHYKDWGASNEGDNDERSQYGILEVIQALEGFVSRQEQEKNAQREQVEIHIGEPE